MRDSFNGHFRRRPELRAAEPTSLDERFLRSLSKAYKRLWEVCTRCRAFALSAQRPDAVNFGLAAESSTAVCPKVAERKERTEGPLVFKLCTVV